jgi:tungstate transport system substrate-binding protein
MHNDFIIVGPGADPGRIRGTQALDALRALARQRLRFVSRADDSGTHRREVRLWREAGVQPSGDWYLEAGVGMGDALLLAGQKRAYILTDRATYIAFRERINLDIMIDGDPPLANKYSVIVVRGARNEAGGRVFAEWLVSRAARDVITPFGVAQYGQPLFLVR